MDDIRARFEAEVRSREGLAPLLEQRGLRPVWQVVRWPEGPEAQEVLVAALRRFNSRVRQELARMD